MLSATLRQPTTRGVRRSSERRAQKKRPQPSTESSHLWPSAARKSMPQRSTSMGRQPRLWMASTQKITPRSRQSRPMASRSLRKPGPELHRGQRQQSHAGISQALLHDVEREPAPHAARAGRSRLPGASGATTDRRSTGTRGRRSRPDRRGASRCRRRRTRAPRWCSSRRRSLRAGRRAASRPGCARARPPDRRPGRSGALRGASPRRRSARAPRRRGSRSARHPRDSGTRARASRERSCACGPS